MNAESTVVAMLSLLSQRGIGRQRARAIIDCPLVETDIACSRDEFVDRVRSHGGANITTDQLLSAWKRSVEQLQRDSEHGIEAISLYDDRFPARLREIPNAPAVLFTKGELQALSRVNAIAIVGTREPTPYGKKVAHRCAQLAVGAGFTVVSGLALGCDTHAHRGCVEANGVGVAVLAHSLDRIYPSANRQLAHALVDEGGCLVSEHPTGTQPSRWSFVDRDRLQSGLSDVVLVVETDTDGGTMHTVKHAKVQRRRLACIKHPERYRLADAARGNLSLLENGWAAPISDSRALTRLLRDIQKNDSTS